jgi:hypothetical protein
LTGPCARAVSAIAAGPVHLDHPIPGITLSCAFGTPRVTRSKRQIDAHPSTGGDVATYRPRSSVLSGCCNCAPPAPALPFAPAERALQKSTDLEQVRRTMTP